MPSSRWTSARVARAHGYPDSIPPTLDIARLDEFTQAGWLRVEGRRISIRGPSLGARTACGESFRHLSRPGRPPYGGGLTGDIRPAATNAP